MDCVAVRRLPRAVRIRNGIARPSARERCATTAHSLPGRSPGVRAHARRQETKLAGYVNLLDSDSRASGVWNLKKRLRAGLKGTLSLHAAY